MKLCRFGNSGDEKPGAIDADGRIRDLSGVIADLGPAELAPERLRALAAIDLATLRQARGDRRGEGASGTMRMARGYSGVLEQFEAVGGQQVVRQPVTREMRAAERRVWQEGGRAWRSRGSPEY